MLIVSQSTLTQVRGKGINRGGLYGFFVKGEGLAGTLTSSSESSSERDVFSAPSSGASTPPTSTSDSETTGKPADPNETSTMAKKGTKRKRDADSISTPNKRQKEETGDTIASTPLGTFAGDQLLRACALLAKIGKDAETWARKQERIGKIGIRISSDPDKGENKDEGHPRYVDVATGKSLKTKEVKYAKGRAIQEAQREYETHLVVEAMMRGDFPNPRGWSREQALERYAEIARTISLVVSAGQSFNKYLKAQKKHKPQANAEQLLERQAKKEQRRTLAEAKAANQQALIARKIAELDPTERAQYEERAAQKDQTLEQYVERRIAKKAEKRASKAASKEDDSAEEPPQDLFVVDLEGDTSVPPPTYTPLPDGTCPLDPTIWEGRVVKHLPKAVRAARREWMRNRRVERKIKAGKPIEAVETRAMMKLAKRATLTAEILNEAGITQGATEEQRSEARRKASKLMKEEKREQKAQKAEGKLKGSKKKDRQNQRGRKNKKEA